MALALDAEKARIRGAYARRQGDARYSWFSHGQLFLAHERERHMLATLQRNGVSSLEGTRILEIGCGTGYWLREFIKWGARPENIRGVDLLPDRIREARKLCPAAVRCESGDAAELALPDEAFDIVLQSTVFTSILDPAMRRRVAAEMLRVVKRHGLILWYDFHVDNPWNLDVRGVTKGQIRQLFPDCRIDLRRITLAPPLLRVLAPRSWLACYVLGRLPWLCTHYVGAIRKR
jgi:ubiquinone/menaquinone biosynthesis C-methylase UbiE